MGKKKKGRTSTGKTDASKNNQVTPTRQEILNRIKPPDSFNFREPASWTDWIKRYKMFHNALGLSFQAEDQQINMLLYCMGQEAEEFLSCLGMTEEKRKSFVSVVAVFEEYFTTKKNTLYYRALFLERDQRPGENTDCYLNELTKLSEKCEWSCKTCKSKSFGNEIMLLKFITGMNDKYLSKSLQIQENVTLTKVLNQLKQSELMKEEKIQDGNDNSTWMLVESCNKILGKQQEKEDLKSPFNRSYLSIHSDCESLGASSSSIGIIVPIHPKEKGSMRSSFSSGMDTGDEYDELSNSRYSYASGAGQEKNKTKFKIGPKHSSVSSGYESGHLNEYNMDFPPLPESASPMATKLSPVIRPIQAGRPTATYDGGVTNSRAGYHNVPKNYSKNASTEHDFYDSTEDEFDSDTELELFILQHCPEKFEDYISYQTKCSLETSKVNVKLSDKPITSDNYNFSVSGHQPRRLLRKQCQQKLKDMKQYSY